MNSRERLLALVAGSMLLLVVGKYVFDGVSAAYDRRQVRIDALNSDILDNDHRQALGTRAAKKLDEYRARSLPTDPLLAKSEYQHWLTKTIEDSRLSDVTVTPRLPTFPKEGKDLYTELSFTVECRGTLEQITSFLYAFYGAGHLHQIETLNLTPNPKSNDVGVYLTVSALSLPGSKNTESLTDQPGDRLAWSDLDAYRKPIVERNFFAEYVPPKPTPGPVVRNDPPKPPPFDISKLAVVSGIIQKDNRPQVWIHVKTTNEMWKLYEGEEITLGEYRATIARIGLDEVEFEVQGQKHVVRLGRSLNLSAIVGPQGPETASR